MTYLDAALLYAHLGWPLFPAHPQTKRPLIKTGRDHAEHASRDADQLAEWFDDGEAAIAMPTGAASGVVVIDADKKHDGERVLTTLEGRYGALPRTKIVRTQSGGIHVYLRHPGAMRIKSCVGGDSTPWPEHGVDVRGDGGIVLLPPSNGYQWQVDIGDTFEPMPAAWIAALRADAKPEHVEIGPVVYTATDVDDRDLNAHRDRLAKQATHYRRSKRPGNDAKADLLDRIVRGDALGKIGERDSSVTRAAYLVGWHLPTIGPDVAERLALGSLMLIPVEANDSEDTDHWISKFRDSYEAGARRSHEEHERQRMFCERMARRFGGAK